MSIHRNQDIRANPESSPDEIGRHGASGMGNPGDAGRRPLPGACTPAPLGLDPAAARRYGSPLIADYEKKSGAARSDVRLQPGVAGLAQNSKSEYRNPKQIRIRRMFKIQNTQPGLRLFRALRFVF
jgi:hypothetical protein